MRVVGFLASAVVASAYTHEEVFTAFSRFAVEHEKTYDSPSELTTRMAIFEDNLERNERENAELVDAGEDAVFGVTKFMDLTSGEFKAQYLMADYESFPRIEEEEVTFPDAGANIDWRTKGAVTAVKDQGQCGSCWAFSAVAAIESYAFLAGKKLQKLSAQQVNSCDKRDGGCNGGNTETAYRYVVSAGGLETESSYPYTSGRGQTGACKFDKSKVAQSIKGYKAVSRSETALAGALQKGPVSVCVAADAFQRYRSGILSSCPGRIDHCVQAVGNTAGAWIVRNSWGTGWGESGYIRVKRGSNLCHIADDATYPTY